MKYTINDIAKENNTYKNKVIRWLKANDINPVEVDTIKNTRYYGESVMIRFKDFLENKDRDKTAVTPLQSHGYYNALLKENEMLKNSVEDWKTEAIKYRQKCDELIQNQQTIINQFNLSIANVSTDTKEQNKRISDLTSTIDKLASINELDKQRLDEQQKTINDLMDVVKNPKQQETISTLTETNQQQLEKIQNLENKLREAEKQRDKAVQDLTEAKQENIELSTQIVKEEPETAKKGFFARLFKR